MVERSFLTPALNTELKRIQLRSKRSVTSDMLGAYRSAFRGSGLIFSDLREYQPGDDIKHIHWKASARSDRVYVKSYDEERELRVILAVDISNSTNVPGVELRKSRHTQAIEFAALVATLAYQSQDSLGLCLFADEVLDFFPPKRTRTQFQRVMSTLLRERALPKKTDLRVALRHLDEHERKSAIIFLISDFLSPTFETELRALSYRHDVICVALEGPGDDELLPPLGLVEYEDAERGTRIQVDTSSFRVRRNVERLRFERLQDLTRICERSRSDLIMSEADPLKPLQRLMQRRTHRR